jgi:hypothetical protein
VIFYRIRADLGAFEPALGVGAGFAAVLVLDVKIIVPAFHAAWCDELECNVVDVKEPGKVEFGERRFDLGRAHLFHSVVETFDVLKVEKGFSKVEYV